MVAQDKEPSTITQVGVESMVDILSSGFGASSLNQPLLCLRWALGSGLGRFEVLFAAWAQTMEARLEWSLR